MALSSRPSEWINRIDKLYTPVLADVMDKLGFRNQSLHPRIRPLWPEARIAGFAMTVQTVPAQEIAPEHPYAGELAAVDALAEGDVMMVSETAWSFWGELLSTAANYRGCRGVILDGPTRDTSAIKKMGFPVFHAGFHPADSLGRLDVVGHNIPINCGGVLIYPNDLVLADHDGVVVVPNAIAAETLRLAEEKVSGENQVRKALAAGMPTAEAFAKFGIL
jgi:4-hydroxy-4-methyl-2-oxoglutarate aldolase